MAKKKSGGGGGGGEEEGEEAGEFVGPVLRSACAVLHSGAAVGE